MSELRAKEEAIDQAERNADPDWIDIAYDALVSVATESEEFIVDAVWNAIPGDVEAPREGRAMGAVVRAAVKDGVITPTGSYIPSNRPGCHRNPRAVWQSLIFERGEEG